MRVQVQRQRREVMQLQRAGITQHNLDTGGQIPGAQRVQTIGGHGGQGQNVIQNVIQRRSLENYTLEITNENRTIVVVAFP